MLISELVGRWLKSMQVFIYYEKGNYLQPLTSALLPGKKKVAFQSRNEILKKNKNKNYIDEQRYP